MEPPLVARADGTVDVVAVEGMLLGIVPNPTYVEAAFHLEHGDTILMTTDGITEARKGKELLGHEGLVRLVEAVQPLETLEQKAQAILSGARAFRENGFRDGVRLVLARRQ